LAKGADEGKGFMHEARVDRSVFDDVNEGRANATGTYVVMDTGAGFLSMRGWGPRLRAWSHEHWIGDD
jgi:hypothetical protein